MLEATSVSAPFLPSSSASGSCRMEDVLDGSFLSSLISRSSASEDCSRGSSCDAIFHEYTVLILSWFRMNLKLLNDIDHYQATNNQEKRSWGGPLGDWIGRSGVPELLCSVPLSFVRWRWGWTRNIDLCNPSIKFGRTTLRRS